MARIAGIDLPVQKRLWIGLTSIYGIGRERAKKLAAKAGVDHTKKIRDLTEEEINHIRQAIEQEGRVEGDLRKEIQMNIRRLIEIQAYRGVVQQYADHHHGYGWPRDVLVFRWRHRFQRLAQGHAVRRTASLAGCRRRRARPVRDEERGSESEGSGLGPRVRGARAGCRRIAHRGDSRCHADSAQRLPSAEAPQSLISRSARNGWATRNF